MGFDPTRLPQIRESYAAKFVVILAAVLLLTGLLGGYAYLHIGDELRSDTHHRLVDTASAETQQLDNWFLSTDRHLGSLSRTSAVHNEDIVVISERLQQTLRRDAVTDVYYLDTSNKEALAKVGGGSLLAETGRVDERVVRRIVSADERSSGPVAYSEAFRLPKNGQPAMLAVAGHPSKDDRFVVAVVSLYELSEYLMGGQDGVAVVDTAGKTVLATDRSDLLTPAAASVSNRDNATGVVSGTAGENETDAVVGYAELESRSWVATKSVPTDRAYSLQADVSRQILMILGVTTLGLVTVGLTLGRNTIRSVRSLSARAERLQDGDLDAGIETDRSDEIGDLFRAFETMRVSLKERIREAESAEQSAESARQNAEDAQKRAETALEAAETAKAESTGLTRHLERTADAYGEMMSACADGDLTQRLDPDERSEAMADIATSFNEMMDEIEATIEATRSFAEAVDESSAESAEGVIEASAASDEVSRSIQEISTDVRDQQEHLEVVMNEMNGLSASVEEIAASTDEVALRAASAAESSEAGRGSAATALDELDSVRRVTRETTAEIEALESELEVVEDIVDLITDIANQTDILAINAAIEASRADEGDGFAVVAEEVKALAQESKSAADDVRDRITEVQERADAAVERMHETDRTVTAGIETTTDALSSLENIHAEIRETNAGIQEISTTIDDQAVSTEEVVTMTEDAATIAHQVTDESASVAAAAEQQAAMLSTVSENVTDLSTGAERLSSHVAAFETRNEFDAAGATEATAEAEPEDDAESEEDVEAEDDWEFERDDVAIGASKRPDDSKSADDSTDEPSDPVAVR